MQATNVSNDYLAEERRKKDEKQLDKGLEDLIVRVNELRNSVNTFIMKLENEYMTMNWLSVLDNFALLSGQVNMINKLLRNDKMPTLRNLALFPLKLCPNRDPDLERLTEGRVAAFNHDVAPLYLRTKPDPEVEEKINLISDKSNKSSAERLQKLTGSLNRHCAQAVDLVRNFRENMDSDGGMPMSKAPSSIKTNIKSAGMHPYARQ